MTPPESQFFQDVLVHYTSAQGLEGILRSNTLWATHASHTNDGEELQTWTKLLDRFCETRFWEGPWESPALKNLTGIIENWRKAIEKLKRTLITDDNLQEIQTYIFSFSEHKKTENHIQKNGRLSQWRAYGDYGIVFNKIEFNKIIYKVPAFVLDPVLYANVDESLEKGGKIYNLFYGLVITYALMENKHINNALSKKVLQLLPLLPEDYDNDESPYFLNVKYYLQIITLIKNIGFEEENEYRLAIFNSNVENHPENFTIRRNRLVPYIDIFHHDPLPIEKILIGPAPAGEQAERKKMVETLLRHLKKDIPVVCSAIPYRG
jgi:hypothetical protein